MGTCSRVATIIDADMIVLKHKRTIFSLGTSDDILKNHTRTGHDVATELGNRYLLKYLVDSDAALFVPGRENDLDDFLQKNRHYVTPTPYSPEEAASWLVVPSPHLPRRYVLLLDPENIQEIWGPRWIRMGGGIEYIVPKGILTRDHIVDVGLPAGKWPLLVT